MPGKAIDLTGKRFGAWMVLSRAPNNKWHSSMWNCECECGRERIVEGGTLRAGKSMGCQSCQVSRRNTMNIKHGQYGTKLYNVWDAMIQRCENPSHKFHKCYGGRGIKVCAEWRNDPAAFINWAITNGYKERLQIDRINNDGNYEPSNCRFVKPKEQQRNRSNNRLIKIGNETKLLIEWAEQTGTSEHNLRNRIRAGWPESRLLEPVHK